MSYPGPSDAPHDPPKANQSGSYGWQPEPQMPNSSSPYMPASQPGTMPLCPLSLGDYFSVLFATIRNSPTLFFGAALIFGSIAAIASAFGEFLLIRSFGAHYFDPYASLDFVASSAIGLMIAASVSQLALIVGQTFNWGMYSIMVGRGAIGMRTSLSQGFRLLHGQWGRLLGILGLAIAVTLLLYGIVIALFFLAVMLGVTGAESNSGIAIAGAVLIGFLAVFGPLVVVIYFGIRWHLVLPSMVVEDLGIVPALRRSWDLTRGYFWRTLGILLLFAIIFGIVVVVITTPLSFISAFATMSPGTDAQSLESTMLASILVNVVITLLSFIATNMGLIVSITLYYDYRFRKEGLGLHFHELASQHAAAANRFGPHDQSPVSADDANDFIPGRGVPSGPQGHSSVPPHHPGPENSGNF